MSSWKMVINKIRNILISNLYYRVFNKNEYLYSKRVDICNKCSHKATHRLIGDYCDICGCPFKSKLRCKNEKCSINKW